MFKLVKDQVVFFLCRRFREAKSVISKKNNKKKKTGKSNKLKQSSVSVFLVID